MASVENVEYESLSNTLLRFYKYVKVGQDMDCHEWIGGKQSNGYGRFCFAGKSIYAHRFVALVKYGYLLPNKDICHKCDNRKCVNPNHLFVGSRKDNMEDAVSKGRQAKGECLSIHRRGEKSSFSKLTNNQVLEIRKLKLEGKKTKDLAREFNISTDNIRRIVRRDTWRYI